MSKGLDALKRYRDIPTTMDYDIIEQELKELDERREMMKRFNEACVPTILDNETEKKLKALEIIKEKRVDVAELVVSCDLKAYNYLFRLVEKWQLTQEEYDLLKEVLS